MRKPNSLLSPAHQKLPNRLALVFHWHCQNEICQANKTKQKAEPVSPAALKISRNIAVRLDKNCSIMFPADAGNLYRALLGCRVSVSLREQSNSAPCHVFRKRRVSLHCTVPPEKNPSPSPLSFLSL